MTTEKTADQAVYSTTNLIIGGFAMGTVVGILATTSTYGILKMTTNVIGRIVRPARR